MATMQFRVSRDEFARIVKSLQRKYIIGAIRGTIDVLETDEEAIERIADFFQEFMIDMEIECVMGVYNYELIIDGETIQLDAQESDGRLKELVKAAMVPWESIKI